MKKLFLFIIWISIGIKLTAQDKQALQAIAFYNLENFFDTINDPNKSDEDFTPNGAYAYTTKVFNEKVENLATVISKLGTDKVPEGISFMGCAEVENESVLNALVNSPKLRDRHLRYVIFYGPDTRGINCGFIYNPKFFKVLEAKSLTVDLGKDERPTRDVLYVVGKLNGETVHIFVNHWPSRLGGEAATRPKRNIAAAVSKHVIDSLMKIDPLTKVVDMGDLNDSPTDESCAKVIGAKAKPEEVEKGGMFNPWIAFYKRGIGTLAYQDTWGLFDQIMISYGFLNNHSGRIHYSDAQVFNKSFMIEKDGQYKGYPKRSFSGNVWNNGFSDHFPTVIYLTK